MKFSNEANDTSFKWWGRHRAKYNLALVLAGIGGFICYATFFSAFIDKMGPEPGITVFTIAFQSVAYLIAIGLANLFYFIGPISETIIKPKDVERYRRITYRLGFWGSVALPFTISLVMLLRV